MNQMAIIQQQLNRGWSPQQIAMTLLQQQQQTPMGANLMNLVQQNKMAEIENRFIKNKINKIKEMIN